MGVQYSGNAEINWENVDFVWGIFFFCTFALANEGHDCPQQIKKQQNKQL